MQHHPDGRNRRVSGVRPAWPWAGFMFDLSNYCNFRIYTPIIHTEPALLNYYSTTLLDSRLVGLGTKSIVLPASNQIPGIHNAEWLRFPPLARRSWKPEDVRITDAAPALSSLTSSDRPRDLCISPRCE